MAYEPRPRYPAQPARIVIVDDHELARAGLRSMLAQEGLTNVRKHAQTTAVGVRLERAGAEVRLVVEDAGRGFTLEALTPEAGAGERVGLPGMRERVAMLGGRCLVESHPGVGTRVSVAVPLESSGADGMADDT